MKKSLKHVYKELMNERIQTKTSDNLHYWDSSPEVSSWTNPNTYVLMPSQKSNPEPVAKPGVEDAQSATNSEPSSNKDEIKRFASKFVDSINKVLNKVSVFKFNLNDDEVNINIKNEKILLTYFIYSKIENASQSKLKSLIKESPDKISQQLDTQDIKKSNPNNDEYIEVRGDDLLNSIINAGTFNEFKNRLVVFLYRKLVKKVPLYIPKDSTIELEDYVVNWAFYLESSGFYIENSSLSKIESDLKAIIDAFKRELETNQAGLSTTIGAFLEVLLQNEIKKELNSSATSQQNESGKDLFKYVAGENINISSKKITLVLFALINLSDNNSTSQSNLLYFTASDKENPIFWKSLFNEAMSSIKIDNITNSIKTILDKYTEVLDLRAKPVSCEEYEKDKLLYHCASLENGQNKKQTLPSENAPFDFIIRNRIENEPNANNAENIVFGLFDLKCTNKNSSSNPFTKGSTGSNAGNSAILNIDKTLKSFRNISDNVSLKFIGLSSIAYELKSKGDKINIEFDVSQNRISSAVTSIQYSKKEKDFYLSDNGERKSSKSSDAFGISKINDSIKEINDVIYGKQTAVQDLLQNFYDTFKDVGVDNNQKIVIDRTNYKRVLKFIFNQNNIQKIFAKLDDVDSLINNAEYDTNDQNESKARSIEILGKFKHSLDAEKLKEIVSQCLAAMIYNTGSDISDIITKVALPLQPSNVKKEISTLILNVFGGNNKTINVDHLNVSGVQISNKAKDFMFNSKHEDYYDTIVNKFNAEIDRLFSASGTPDNDVVDNSGVEDSYIRPGKTLMEVYSYLFDLKKTINEGALGGHMMHPYEALDMTPEQLARRIKQYGVPQKIIEKVDGQNLFFTVETDGTLLFARNKEDMTHDDLVEKFTGHPAEKPFIEGGNAIKSGVASLLSSVSQEEVIKLFHPAEGIRTFVNFEIMHPEKPNQIIYDEKYIVFHGIVDYRNGREEVSRSNQDQRIQELVTLMSSGVSSAGFTLASNREVDLNQLTDIQIAEYTQKIYDISEALGMEEGETLGDGIMNVIGDEIEAEGVSLSDEALTIFTDYIVRGEDSEGRSIASREWTKLLSKEDVVKLRQLGLTSTAKVKTKIGQILQPFKALFVELGIDLLKGVQSSYMSADMNIENVELIRDKLSTAISDLENYINSVPEEEWSNSIKRLIPHMELINRKGLDNIVSSAVEGGVYSANDNLFKVTGGFAPMNQIIGAAYRDNEGIFTTFKEKFMQQENNRRSLRDIFSLIF
jgi:hypothetical protein